jgi:hypothetical protein
VLVAAVVQEGQLLLAVQLVVLAVVVQVLVALLLHQTHMEL